MVWLVQGVVLAQSGSPDSSFGTNGRVKENLGYAYIVNQSLVSQADGKIVVLAKSVYAGKDKAVILRYLANGTLDNGFGTNGIQVLFGSDTTVTGGSQLRVQADGKVLVCGHILKEHTKPFVARLNLDGSFDAGFNGTGIVLINSATPATCLDMLLLPNNKIVAFTSHPEEDFPNDLQLFRFETNGSLDNSFGTNGRAVISAFSPKLQSIAVQPDGKMVILGDIYGHVVVRLKANGSVDSTFATNGMYKITYYPTDYESNNLPGNLLVQPDGKILWGSYKFTKSVLSAARVTRLLANGTLDNSFASLGTLEIPATNGYRLTGHIALQTDGKIMMAGLAGPLDNYDMAVARITANGLLDTGFDGDGYATIAVTNKADYGQVPYVQSDGKILVSGISNDGQKEALALARFLPTGASDNGFGVSGKLATYVGSTPDVDMLMGTYIQPDQKIVSLRVYSTGTSESILVVRHLPNGGPDSSFGTNGAFHYSLPAKDLYGTIQHVPNGKILVAFSLNTPFEGKKNFLLQLNANGSLDAGFGTNGLVGIAQLRDGFNSVRYIVIDSVTSKTHLLIHTAITGLNHTDTVWVLRLKADGSYDSTYNGTGKVAVNFATIALTLQRDGKVICLGEGNGATRSFLLSRYNANGTPDMGFNGGNLLVLASSPGGSALPQALIVLPNNKLLLLHPSSGLTKLNADGSYDSSFVQSSSLMWTYSHGYAYCMQVDTSGRIVLAGFVNASTTGGYQPQGVLWRYNANGTTDSSFANNGESRLDLGLAVHETWQTIDLQADGKIIVTGVLDRSVYSDWPYEGVDRLAAPLDFVMRRFVAGYAAGGKYTFTGSGNWNTPSNWSNNTVPPSILPNGSEIIIDPATGSCTLNVPVTVQSGAKITVKAGKSFVVQGNLILQ